MPQNRWKWLTNTYPFSAINDCDQPARFVVEQIGDSCFRIPRGGPGFQYNPEQGDPIRVTFATLPETDYASIPRYMAWLVSRYGRHTPAALVHDQEIVNNGMPYGDRKKADLRFLVMMDHLDVPPVQSRVMWAAVTLATRFKGTSRSKAGIVAWAAMAAAGIGLLVVGFATGTPLMIVVALLGPAVGALAWGDQYWAGVVAGYALPVVALPALTSLLGYGAYWVVEQSVKVIRQQFKQNKAKELPGPISYQGR